MRKKRGSSRYYILFIFFAIVLFSSACGIKYLVKNLDFFKIEKIIICGNKNLETEFLSNIMKDLIGKNLFDISKDDILPKYQNIIRIDDVSMKRKLPNKLVIKISEKVGYLYIKTREGELFPIAKDKVILDNTQVYENEILPIVQTDISIKELNFGQKLENEWLDRVFALSDVLQQKNMMDDISEIYYKNEEIYLVQATIGYRIIPGKDNLEQKFGRYLVLRDNRNFSKNNIVDLRFEDKLIVKPGV